MCHPSYSESMTSFALLVPWMAATLQSPDTNTQVREMNQNQTRGNTDKQKHNLLSAPVKHMRMLTRITLCFLHVMGERNRTDL